MVIPAVDEEETVADVVRRVSALGEVVVVDDGSSDATAVVAAAAGAHVVKHSHNRGYDAALASGFRAALERGADVIVSVDADGEQALDTVAGAVDDVANGKVDVALGVRPAPSRWSERLFSLYTRARYGVPDILCGVKVYAGPFVASHLGDLDRRTIGTGLAAAALREGRPFLTFPVQITTRRTTRFGHGLRPNLRIARAMADALVADAAAAVRRR